MKFRLPALLVLLFRVSSGQLDGMTDYTHHVNVLYAHQALAQFYLLTTHSLGTQNGGNVFPGVSACDLSHLLYASSRLTLNCEQPQLRSAWSSWARMLKMARSTSTADMELPAGSGASQ